MKKKKKKIPWRVVKCAAVHVESNTKSDLCIQMDVAMEIQWILNIPSFNRMVKFWIVTEVMPTMSGRELILGSYGGRNHLEFLLIYKKAYGTLGYEAKTKQSRKFMMWPVRPQGVRVIQKLVQQ
jgi:hypothetical protein